MTSRVRALLWQLYYSKDIPSSPSNKKNRRERRLPLTFLFWRALIKRLSRYMTRRLSNYMLVKRLVRIQKSNGFPSPPLRKHPNCDSNKFWLRRGLWFSVQTLRRYVQQQQAQRIRWIHVRSTRYPPNICSTPLVNRDKKASP